MLTRLYTQFSNAVDHPDFAKLLLRLVFGILMLFHGTAKMHNGVEWVKPMLAAHGLPGFVAYGAYIGEVIAPVLIIVGLLTRVAGLVYAFNLVVAVLLVGMGHFFMRTEVGAWALETEALYFFGGIFIMLLGAGKYSPFKGKLS